MALPNAGPPAGDVVEESDPLRTTYRAGPVTTHTAFARSKQVVVEDPSGQSPPLVELDHGFYETDEPEDGDVELLCWVTQVNLCITYSG